MSYYTPTDDLSFIPFTVEEEKDYFNRFYSGDIVARDEIIRRHLKLVIKLSLACAKGALPEEDAISAGNVGLLQCLESKCFDPNRGFRFASYVRSYVRGQVLTALRERGWKGAVSEDHDRTGLPEDAAVTGVNGSRTNDYGTNRWALVGLLGRQEKSWDLENAVDHEYEAQQLNEVRRTQINEALKTLSPFEACAVRRVEMEGKSHADVGREWNVSREASRKAHARGLEKLRVVLAALQPELS